jgi:aspartate dehydrogenase
MRFANLPSPDNPKTSAITAASLLREVTHYLAGRLIPEQ